MKWFKHHTDNHRGRSIQDLMDQMGHVGLSYYIILEMCAEKLQKSKDEVVTESDCLFHFSQRIVRHSCRISQTNLRRLLDICQTNGLLSWKEAANEIEISMPILLDLLEKNLKKRTIRGLKDSLKHPLDKEIDKDKEIDTEYIITDTAKKQKTLDQAENKKIKDAYFNAYRLRYGVEPVSNAAFNSQISNLRKKLGVDDSVGVVEFYLKHNDSFYLKNTHSFGLCLSNAETLRTQMLRGKPITSLDVRNFEKTQNAIQINESIKNGENF